MKARKTNKHTRKAGGVKPSGAFSKFFETPWGDKRCGKVERHENKLARIAERLGNPAPKRNARIEKKLAKRKAEQE